MATVYISIGNSDDKLTQAEWAAFYAHVRMAIRPAVDMVHGEWVSDPTSRWQNACWCVDIDDNVSRYLRADLGKIGVTYRQDSIAWAPVSDTEFLTGATS